MTYNWDFAAILKFGPTFYRGAVMTLYLTLLSMVASMALGLLLALARDAKRSFVRIPAAVYVEFFRGTPFLVQLVWLYYCLPILIGVQFAGLTTGVVALSLNMASYLSEIFRAGVESIDKGQVHAARALGMSKWQTMRRIVLPQAIRRMIPPFVNEFANLLKLSAIVSVIGVYELMMEANNLIISTFRPLEIYTTVAVAYFVITYPFILLSKNLEQVLKKRYGST